MKRRTTERKEKKRTRRKEEEMKRSEEKNLKKETWRYRIRTEGYKASMEKQRSINGEEESEEEIRHRIKTKRKDNKDNK